MLDKTTKTYLKKDIIEKVVTLMGFTNIVGFGADFTGLTLFVTLLVDAFCIKVIGASHKSQPSAPLASAEQPLDDYDTVKREKNQLDEIDQEQNQDDEKISQ